MWIETKKQEKTQVTSVSGHSFSVDISDSAVGHFGFHHNDRVLVRVCSDWYYATVIGVAHAYEWRKNKGREVLWLSYDVDNGKVTFNEYLTKGDDITLLR
jgi:hypothetical protein